MIADMYRMAGTAALCSQFVIVILSTPMQSATCFCKSLRSRRCVRMWSPNVLICLALLRKNL